MDTRQGDETMTRLTEVLQSWLADREWDDEVQINADWTASRVVTRYLIGEQPHNLYIEVNEELEQLHMFLYSPFNVPAGRVAEITRVLNSINRSSLMGTVTCADNGEPTPIQYRVGIDVEGSALTPVQISNLLSAVGCLAEVYSQVLATVAMTATSAEEAWQQFVAEQERRAAIDLEAANSLPC